MSYFRLARWRMWVGMWLCCMALAGGIFVVVPVAHAAPAAPAKTASAQDGSPLIGGDTGPTLILNCGGFRHNPGDFTSLPADPGGGYAGADGVGHSCDGSFSYVPTPTTSSVSWPAAIFSSPNGTLVDVWAWIPTQDASAIVDYTAQICETRQSCGYVDLTPGGFDQSQVSGWQYVGGVQLTYDPILGQEYLTEITMSVSNLDTGSNTMGESAIGTTVQGL